MKAADDESYGHVFNHQPGDANLRTPKHAHAITWRCHRECFAGLRANRSRRSRHGQSMARSSIGHASEAAWAPHLSQSAGRHTGSKVRVTARPRRISELERPPVARREISHAQTQPAPLNCHQPTRRDAGAVDRSGLENRSGVRATGGSNPSPSATNPLANKGFRSATGQARSQPNQLTATLTPY